MMEDNHVPNYIKDSKCIVNQIEELNCEIEHQGSQNSKADKFG